jgi:SAM-dependent methyltransferase
MDDLDQARAYAEADFEAPHSLFIEMLGEELADLPSRGRSLDLGCGPGDISFRVARALPGWQVDAVDGSAAMIGLAEQRAAEDAAGARVKFCHAYLPTHALEEAVYDLIFSNSLMHHLPDPQILWASVRRYGANRARFFVMDLMRPESESEVEALVALHACGEPLLLQRDFRLSLYAAYRPAEIEAQLAEAGLKAARVKTVSDRHWIAWA